MAEALYGGVDDGTAAQEDARALGVILPPREPPKPVEVWEENWEAFNIALLMLNEWNYAGMTGQPTGYNKQTMQWYFKVAEVKDDAAMLAQMRVFERVGLEIITKRMAPKD